MNRLVLERIKETGNIFMAWSDRSSILDGAAVRVSIVGFDDCSETQRSLDGATVRQINLDLTSALDLIQVRRLLENEGVAYMGMSKRGAFVIYEAVAQVMLAAPTNLSNRTKFDVVRPSG